MRGLDGFDALFVDREHLIRIAVVRRNHGDASQLPDDGQQPPDALIDSLHRDNGRFRHARVAYHVAVGIICSAETIIAALEQIDHRIRYFFGLHLRRAVKFNPVGRNFHVFLEGFIDAAGAVAVPEIRYMAVFLRFRYGEGFDLFRAEVFADDAVDGRRLHQKMRRDVGVAVVFHHPRVKDIRQGAPVEFGKVLFGKGPGDFDRAVAPEVEQDNGIPVLNFSDGSARGVGHHKRGQVLVRRLWVFRVKSFDCVGSGREGSAFSQDMGLPAALHDVPVGIVAVHGGRHPPAARGDGVIQAFFR